MLDPLVSLTLVAVPHSDEAAGNGIGVLQQNLERARKLGREVLIKHLGKGPAATELVRLAQEGKYDLVIAGATPDLSAEQDLPLDIHFLVRNAPCKVFVATPPVIPQEPEQELATPAT
jgi:hypothetical protein